MLCGSAGLCGGSASGKTTVANKIIEALDVPWVVLLSMDSFYKVRESRILVFFFVLFHLVVTNYLWVHCKKQLSSLG